MNRHTVLVTAVITAAALCIALLLTACGNKSRVCGATKAEVSTAVKFAVDVVNNRYASIVPKLNDTMKTSLTKSRLSQITSTLHGKFGDVVSTGSPVAKQIQGYDVVYIPAGFARYKGSI